MSQQIQIDTRELQALAQRLQSVNDKVKVKELRNILKQAAKPVLGVVKQMTPVRGVYRSNKKGGLVKSSRSTKYDTPMGNLRDSMQIFVAKKGIAVHVGARVASRGVTLSKGGRLQNDGYYNFFLNFGTKHMAPTYHMERAEAMALPMAESLATADMKKYLVKVINRAK